MGSAGTTGLTYEDLQAFPDDHFRRELLDGELIVTPAPGRRHQRVVVRLAAALLAWVDEHGGEVLTAPFDVYFTNDTVVEPDVLVVRAEHLERFNERFLRSAPDLVIEVGSPSTRRTDLVRKRRLYERFGVPEYWFVDLEHDRVLVHRLRGDRYGLPRIVTSGQLLRSEQLPGFALDLARLLAPPPA